MTIPPHLCGTATLVDRQTGEVLYSPDRPACGPIGEPEPGAKGGGKRGKRKPTELHMHMCAWHGDKLLIVVGIQTANETNQRDWKAKNRRAGEAWQRTREAVRIPYLADFENAFLFGKPVKIEFCRLAPRQIDRGSVGAACKGVEDSLAYLCGTSDGSPLWQAVYTQEKSRGYGVRIIMELS